MKLPPGGQRDMQWHGAQVPEFGDVLRMNTGRMYQVIGHKGRVRTVLRVLVLKPGDHIDPNTPVWDTYWVSRGRQRRRG
jgi:hypothetical protein